ncbi:MAG: hypothetical protein VX589_07930 [Myxococcota bacterium]|nr:hypothetical protein [Myxococcota bacterium]
MRGRILCLVALSLWWTGCASGERADMGEAGAMAPANDGPPGTNPADQPPVSQASQMIPAAGQIDTGAQNPFGASDGTAGQTASGGQVMALSGSPHSDNMHAAGTMALLGAGTMDAGIQQPVGGTMATGGLMVSEMMMAGVSMAGDDGPTGGTAQPRPRPPLECGDDTTCGRICVNLLSDPMNCGACGRACFVANGRAACVDGECGIDECLPGYFDDDGDVQTGCELMSDCIDGIECMTSCGGTGLQVCDAGIAMCQTGEELCNAKDDDCNGQCDEGAIDGCRTGIHRGYGRGGHIYTEDRGQIVNRDMRVESENYFYLYQNPVQGMRPVFFCPADNDQFFLSSQNDCEINRGPVKTLGFWAADQVCGSVPLFRLRKNDDHFYTISAPERDRAIRELGFDDLGIAGYVWRSP